MNKVVVLCEAADCVYHMFDPTQGKAYQNYCGNDEIEIGWKGQCLHCYSYEKETEKEAGNE